MSIAVNCPHCESQFNLQPELIGKSIRCPNSDCREIFVVQPQGTPQPEATTSPASAEPPPVIPSPAPFAASESPPPVPILEGEAVPTSPPPERLASPMPERVTEPEPLVPIFEGESTQPEPLPTSDDQPLILAEEVPPAAPRAPIEPTSRRSDRRGPKVVDWQSAAPPVSPATSEPKPEPKRIARRETESEAEIDLESLGLPRRRGSGVWKYVLGGLIVTIVFLGAYTGIQYVINEARQEERLANEAQQEFKNQNYQQAVKLYEKLQADYGTSPEMPRYQFFGKLSDVLTTISSVTIRDNPAEGQAKFDAFLQEYKDSPLSKPTDTGYGFDIFEAGRKLVEAYADNAELNLKNFLEDRNRRELLDAAEVSIAAGRKLVPLVDRYRIKEVAPLEAPLKRFGELSAKIARERERLRVIDPYRDLAKEPTDERIAEFQLSLKQTRFDQDFEAQELIAKAKAELRRLIQGLEDFRPPVTSPRDPAGGLLFVASPLGQSTLPIILPANTVPEVFFTTARGVLYALDTESGSLLWATRVGRSMRDLPTRVPSRMGQPELVLLQLEREGYGLSARIARTGVERWYQPLEAAPAGQPVVVNGRVYVPLRDDLGTIVEFDTNTGNRLSLIRVRQRIGPGAVHLPGSGMIFVAAEARRVFAINTEPFDAEGNRLPIQCVQVLSTDHPELSLKVPPIVTGPIAAAGAGNRFLILAQAEGTQSTKMRAFPISPAEPFDPAVGPPEVIPKQAGSVTIPGHVIFPPYTDGERVAVVTDAGAFGLFATNQPGNQDASIYSISSMSLPTNTNVPQAGLVLSAEEDLYWALSRGSLYRLRVALTPENGLRVSPVGLSIPAGIPMQQSQLNSRRDLALIVVRSDDSDSIRAIAFDPRDGRARWQRKLGIAPNSPPVSVTSTETLVVDEDGGLYMLPATALERTARKTEPIESSWVIAPPIPNAKAPAKVCVSSDGKTVWIVVPEQGEKERLQIRFRKVVEGQAQADEIVQLPDRLAGPPILAGGGVVLPCANGFLYRFDSGSTKLIQGPMWRGEGVGTEEPCWTSSTSETEFLATDGNKGVSRYVWSAAGDGRVATGPWKLRDKIAFTPRQVEVNTNERRLFIADQIGNIWMHDANAVGEPLRRWRSSKDDPDNPIPAGLPTTNFVFSSTPVGLVVTYVVENRHLVAISPSSEKAIWVVRRLGAADVLGIQTVGNAFLVTDISGVITAYASPTGDRTAAIRSENLLLLPRTVAGLVGGGKWLLIPLLDGSVMTLPNPID